VLASVVEALRNDPDRYLLIDRTYNESPSYLPRYLNQNSIKAKESSNNLLNFIDVSGGMYDPSCQCLIQCVTCAMMN
jgi:hypothetical protein